MGDAGGAPGYGRKLLSAGVSVTRFAGRLVLNTASRAWSAGVAQPPASDAPSPPLQIPAAAPPAAATPPPAQALHTPPPAAAAQTTPAGAAAPAPSPAPGGGGVSSSLAAVLEAKQREGFTHGDYAAIIAALAENVNAAAAAESAARTPVAAPGAPAGLLSPVEAAAAAAASTRTPYSAARAVLHAAALQPLRPRLTSPPFAAAAAEAAEPYALAAYGYGGAGAAQPPQPPPPVYGYTPQRTPRAPPAAVPEWHAAARPGGGATPASLKRPFAELAAPPPPPGGAYGGAFAHAAFAGAYAGEALPLQPPGDARDVRRRTDAGEFTGAVTPPPAPAPPAPQAYDAPRGGVLFAGAGPTAAGTTETAAKILETLRSLTGAAGPPGWGPDAARAPLPARTPPPPPPTGSLTEVTPPARPPPPPPNALTVERAAALVGRRPAQTTQQEAVQPPQPQQPPRPAAPAPAPPAAFQFGVPAAPKPPPAPAPSPPAAPKPAAPAFASPWAAPPAPPPAAASAAAAEAATSMEDSGAETEEDDLASYFTFTAPASARTLPPVAAGRAFAFPPPGTAAAAEALRPFAFAAKPLTPEAEREQRLLDAACDDGAPVPRFLFGKDKGAAAAAASPAAKSAPPAAAAAPANGGGGGGWDPAFLARNSQASVAATKAIEAEIAKAKGGGLSAPQPAAFVPPPAAAAAAGGGGWDTAFLARNVASTQAAQQAIAAEIEKAKGGAGAAKPAAQQFKFGL